MRAELTPNLCQTGTAEFLNNKEFIAEYKFDGDRCIAEMTAKGLKLWNRRGNDITFRYPEIVKNILLPIGTIIDSEIIVMKNGKDSFNEGIAFRSHLQNKYEIEIRSELLPAKLMVFDILFKGGVDVRHKPLMERKEILKSVVKENDFIKLSVVYDDLQKIFDETKAQGSEGVVLKKRNSIYENKRTQNWIKIKHIKEAIIVVDSYEVNNAGITLIRTSDNVRIQCGGEQSKEVKRMIDNKGQAEVEINYLEITNNGRYRMPTFNKLCENRNI